MTALTFGQVKAQVLARAGEACAESDDVDLLMLNALYDINNVLGEAEQQARDELTVEAGTAAYAIPASVAVVHEVYDAYGRSLARGKREVSDLVEERSGRPETWEIVDGEIVFHPVPDEDTTMQVLGLSVVNSTLYTVVSDVRVWSTVSLPVEIHPIFYKWVLGLAMLDADPARGAMWITLAEQELTRWKVRRATSRSPLAMNGAPLRVRPRRRLDDVSRYRLEP